MPDTIISLNGDAEELGQNDESKSASDSDQPQNRPPDHERTQKERPPKRPHPRPK